MNMNMNPLWQAQVYTELAKGIFLLAPGSNNHKFFIRCIPTRVHMYV